MTGPRWKLWNLLVFVIACGVAFAAYRYFWMPPPSPNAGPYLSAYLALLAPASLGSFFARPSWRRPLQGFALYGWCNLVFVMWGGFGLSTFYDAQRVAEGSQMGVVFGALSALQAAWLLELPAEGPGRPASPE